jgi:hypothetical protein
VVHEADLDLQTSYANGRPFPHDAYLPKLMQLLQLDAATVADKVRAGQWTDRMKGSWYKRWLKMEGSLAVDVGMDEPVWGRELAPVPVPDSFEFVERFSSASSASSTSSTTPTFLTVSGCNLQISDAFQSVDLEPLDSVSVRYVHAPQHIFLCARLRLLRYTATAPPNCTTSSPSSITINGISFPASLSPSPVTPQRLFTMLKYAKKLTSHFQSVGFSNYHETDAGMAWVRVHHDENRDPAVLAVKEGVTEGWLEYNADPAENNGVEVVVTLEPLSHASQKLLPVLVYLRDVVKVHLKVLPIGRCVRAPPRKEGSASAKRGLLLLVVAPVACSFKMKVLLLLAVVPVVVGAARGCVACSFKIKGLLLLVVVSVVVGAARGCVACSFKLKGLLLLVVVPVIVGAARGCSIAS